MATEDDRQRATIILAELFPKARLRIERDYPAAFVASPDGTDVCVIAGTGSLVCSRIASESEIQNPKSKIQNFQKSGGNGYVLGDDGSAFQYGRALLRHHIDMDKLSEISEDIRAVFSLPSTLSPLPSAEIIAKVYKAPNIPQTLAKLAPAFAKAAEAKQDFAINFLQAESALLASVVVGHVSKFLPKKQEISLSLAGGLWKISPVFKDALMNALHTSDSTHTYRAQILTRPPVEGAVILARELASQP